MQESRQLMHTMWLDVLRRYLAFVLVGNLLWEFAQLPLYTIWHHGTPGEMAFAALHCTAGDALIASASLLIALMMFGQSNWPSMRYLAVAAAAMAFGLAYTIFSEWWNTSVRNSWTYAEAMPRLPLGIGLSPVAQWIVIPCLAFWWARSSASMRSSV